MDLPAELVREIHKWIRLFQQRDATDRVLLFKQTYSAAWNPIMAAIRQQVPRYTFILTTGTRNLRVSVFAPDCQPELWPGIRQNDRITITRRVATIHEEFMRSQELTQGSNPLAIQQPLQ
jgi:hypothetical protein